MSTKADQLPVCSVDFCDVPGMCGDQKHAHAGHALRGKQMERGLRQRLTREANRLARETFDRDVTWERLVIIRDRLAEIDAVIYGPPSEPDPASS